MQDHTLLLLVIIILLLYQIKNIQILLYIIAQYREDRGGLKLPGGK